MEIEIYVKEENSRLPVSADVLRSIAETAYGITGKEPRDVSLLVCDDETIRTLNRRYRKLDMPTDVLSFSMDEGMWQGVRNSIIGDIIISTDTAARQARALEKSIDAEFRLLFTHGLLHLLGYDHADDESSALMERITSRIVAEATAHT
jgi:rRNA maturation RNase YbeY